MAYHSKDLKLLAAPLNYSTPGDKIGQRYSQIMSNWRIDGKGHLRSREGIEQVGASNVGERIHTLLKSGHAIGMYVAAGSDLYADQGATNLSAAFDGVRLGTANAGSFAYFMNRNGAKKRKAGGSLVDWSILPPSGSIGSAAGTGTGLGNGDYSVYVTFVNADGDESNPSEPIEVTLTNQQLILTGIPTSPDSQVSIRRIYVGGGTLSQILLLVELSDNTTTSITVDVDESLIVVNPGIEMRTDRDPVPNGRILAGPYFQRLIVASTEEEPHAYWWTETNEFGSISVFNKNFIGGGDFPILAITHHQRMLIFYKADGVWRLQNDPATTGDQEKTNASFGPVGLHAVVSASSLDYFVSQIGCFAFDGDRSVEISQQVRGIWEGDRYIPVTRDFAVRPMTTDPDARATTAIGFDGRRVWISYPEQGCSSPNRTLIYDPQQNEWSGYRVAAALGSGEGFTEFAYDPGTASFFGASTDGFFYHLDHGSTDGGSAIPVAYFSHYEDFGEPDLDKIIDDLVIKGNAHGQNITVKLWANNGETEYALGTFNRDGPFRQVFSARDASITTEVGLRGRNVAIDLNGDVSSQEAVEIDSVILHYRFEQRESRSFDSGPFNVGTDKVKTLYRFEIDLESTVNCTWTLESDLPHNALTVRATGTLLRTNGIRQSVFIKLPTPVDGIRFRFTLECPELFRAHEVWMDLLVIGEFISGDAGDCFETQAMSFT